MITMKYVHHCRKRFLFTFLAANLSIWGIWYSDYSLILIEYLWKELIYLLIICSLVSGFSMLISSFSGYVGLVRFQKAEHIHLMDVVLSMTLSVFLMMYLRELTSVT